MEYFWGYKGLMGFLLFLFWCTVIATPFIITPIILKILKTLENIKKELENKNKSNDKEDTIPTVTKEKQTEDRLKSLFRDKNTSD